MSLGLDAVTMPDGADLIQRLADKHIELVSRCGRQKDTRASGLVGAHCALKRCTACYLLLRLQRDLQQHSTAWQTLVSIIEQSGPPYGMSWLWFEARDSGCGLVALLTKYAILFLLLQGEP